MNGDGGRAVFEVICLLVRLEREFSFFSDRHETGLELDGSRRRENESTRVYSYDRVHHPWFHGVAKQINASTEQLRIGQNRGDVLELNSGFGKISNVPDGAFDLGGCNGHKVQVFGLTVAAFNAARRAGSKA